jgi:uncharacterized protein YecT (DUF1311 family)
MRSLLIGFGALVAAALGCAGNALAEVPSQCRVLASDPMALQECLQSELDASYLAMNEALAGVRAVAARTDQATGREIAVLAVEASQHAWESYRDTACQARAAFVDGGSEAAATELACEIELIRSRTEELLGLGSLASG